MTQRRWADRSRIETYQRCPRSRYLAYHQDGTGISSAKTPLALCVGGAVHKGLESLLTQSMHLYDGNLMIDEDLAVKMAVEELALRRGAGLELDTTEQAAQAVGQVVAMDLGDQLAKMAADLGVTVDDPVLAALTSSRRSGAAMFDDYLWQEQCALVEGLVRAYARRRLRLLLEEFEVLEVEREGEWLLSEWGVVLHSEGDLPLINIDENKELWFMSRPDALLRSRSDNSLYLLSYKTAAQWDIRKARDAEHDMQGLSEGIEVERRLGEWWQEWDTWRGRSSNPPKHISPAMGKYLGSLSAPPRILGIRYEYLIKGSRWKDKELSARVGFDAYSQRSHLVRCYVSKKDDAAVNWSWDFIKEDGSSSNLAWQTWKSQPVWDRMSVKSWIDLLGQSTMTMTGYDSTVGNEPRELGYGGPAQATGTTIVHPLDSVFIPPIVIYRVDDDLRDLVEQMESQERRIVDGLVQIESAGDADQRRSLLNQYFGQSRRACSYPSECQFVRVCYGGEDIRRNPLDSGLYKRREVNHPVELTGKVEAGQ